MFEHLSTGLNVLAWLFIRPPVGFSLPFTCMPQWLGQDLHSGLKMTLIDNWRRRSDCCDKPRRLPNEDHPHNEVGQWCIPRSSRSKTGNRRQSDFFGTFEKDVGTNCLGARMAHRISDEFKFSTDGFFPYSRAQELMRRPISVVLGGFGYFFWGHGSQDVTISVVL